MTNIELYATIALAVLLITDVVVFLVYYVKLKRFMRVTNRSLELTEKIGKTELEMLDLHQEHLQKHDKMFSLLGDIMEDVINRTHEDVILEHDSDFAQYMIDKLLELVFDISENDKAKTEKADQEANKSYKKKSHVKKNGKN